MHAERRRFLSPFLPYALPPLALYVSLALLRQRLTADMGLTFDEALESGIVRGWFFDGVMVLAASMAASILWLVLALPLRIGWTLLALFLWSAAFANVLHFGFFRIPLDWWIVEMHWHEVGLVKGSAAELSIHPVIVASALFALLAIVLNVLRPFISRRLGVETTPAPFWTERSYALARGVFFYALVGIGWKAPAHFGKHQQSTASAITDNIVRQWYQQNWSRSLYQGVGTKWTDKLDDHLTPEEQRKPASVLASYRDYPGTRPTDAHLLATRDGAPPHDLPRLDASKRPPPLAAGEEWPLYVDFTPDAEESRALRADLGLPETGPIHVVFLFSESMRALELYRPETGPQTFPRLLPLLDKHGVVFTQAYSSSFSAGQTVRGQYSTQCSMLPNMLGAAEYIAHTTVRVGCVQEYLKQNGYRTTWFNSFRDTFHGKRAFEKLHGMEEFYDGDFFRQKGITQQIGDWGLADRPMLQETVKKLNELATQGKPLYSNILTISTHHPFSVIPEGPLAPELAEKSAGNEQYAGYLSRFRYADDAISDFFEALFASPMGDNTLVVFLGDHGSPVGPFMNISPSQAVEMRFRIPLAFLTKNMPKPRRLTHPVHQVDIVPTVGHIVGLPGKVTWVGRNMFRGEGSPWVYIAGASIHYRVGKRACYTLPGARVPTCYDLGDTDPLLQKPSNSVDADPNEELFLRKVAEANMRAVVLNLVAPPTL